MAKILCLILGECGRDPFLVELVPHHPHSVTIERAANRLVEHLEDQMEELLVEVPFKVNLIKITVPSNKTTWPSLVEARH